LEGRVELAAGDAGAARLLAQVGHVLLYQFDLFLLPLGIAAQQVVAAMMATGWPQKVSGPACFPSVSWSLSSASVHKW